MENDVGMKIKLRGLAVLLACLFPFAGVANAAIAFSDDFEDDLSQWTGKDGGAHDGILVDDPLRAGNRVLSFSASNIGGDIFSESPLDLVAGTTYVLSFEYLGLATQGSVEGDLGGFIGLSEGLPGRHRWIFGTEVVSNADDALIDDGQWRLYSYTFVAPLAMLNGGGVSSDLRVMLEDFAGSLGVAGDVYFDNIELRAVPLPAAAWMFIGGLLTLLRLRR